MNNDLSANQPYRTFEKLGPDEITEDFTFGANQLENTMYGVQPVVVVIVVVIIIIIVVIVIVIVTEQAFDQSPFVVVVIVIIIVVVVVVTKASLGI